MSFLRRVFILLLLVLGATLFVWYKGWVPQLYAISAWTNFSAITLEGKVLNEETFRNQVVVLNFWSPTCASCVREMPKWIEFFQKNKDNGLSLIAVAMPYDSPSQIEAFVRRHQLTFDVIHDKDGKVYQRFFKTIATPMVVLVDSKGLLRKRFVGPVSSENLQNTINQLLIKR